jgi:hypothetical protein
VTEQQITVTKIEPNPRCDGWWYIHAEGCTIYQSFNTNEVRAMGLTLPAPPLTVTIGEHTATINRDDAQAYAQYGEGQVVNAEARRRAAVALADLIRTALEDGTDG